MKKRKTGYWNYRIMVDEYKGEKFFEIHEVHYTAEGQLRAYSANGVTVYSDSKIGIKSVLLKMAKAYTKPILWKGERWPQEYNGKIPKLKLPNLNINTVIDLKPKRVRRRNE